MINYRVLKDKGVYILVIVPYFLSKQPDYACFLHELNSPLTSVWCYADYIWSTNISFTLVERIMAMDDKTPCHRLAKVSFVVIVLHIKVN